MILDSNEILSFFKILNENKIEYVLLRNIGNELPHNLEQNKDIDILVKEEYKEKFKKVIISNGWCPTQHPWDFGNNFVFLYGMDQLEMYKKNLINIDVCYQLCCRSVNNGEWMPVDQIINNSVWINRKKNIQYGWFELSAEDQLLHLLTRCILDKKEFKEDYIDLISELLNIVDINELNKRLEVVFFKYTPILIDKIRQGHYDSIIEDYLQFWNY